MSFDDSKSSSIAKLTRSTYASWKPRMLAILMQKGYWGVVSGKLTRDAAKDELAFDSHCEIASGLIFLNVDEEMQRIVTDLLEKGDAVGMWKALEEECLSKRPGARFNAYDDLFSIRKQEGESLTSLSGRVANAVRTIRDLRPSSFTLEKMEEELECMALIRALPDEYSAFSSSLMLVDDLKKTTVLEAFKNEEANQKRRADTDPIASSAMSISSSSPSNRSAQHNAKNGPGKRSKLICDFCHRAGHSKQRCFKYLESHVKAFQAMALEQLNGDPTAQDMESVSHYVSDCALLSS